MNTAGQHSARFRDRTGDVVGALTILRYLRTDRERSAVWACRCDCGRDGCKGEVERSSHALRNRAIPDCQEFPRNVRRPWEPRSRLVTPPPLPPEGPRPPWSRSADERAARDAKLLGAFSRADLR